MGLPNGFCINKTVRQNEKQKVGYLVRAPLINHNGLQKVMSHAKKVVFNADDIFRLRAADNLDALAER